MRRAFESYNALGVLGVLLMLSSFISFRSTADIHIHDTYIVMDFPWMFRALSVTLFLFWLLYRSTSSILYSTILTSVHVWFTVISVIIIAVGAFQNNVTANPDFRYTNFQGGLALFALLLLSGQLVYFVNLIAGTIRRINSRPRLS